MSEMSKVEDLAKEKFETKEYIKTKNIHQARMMFKVRTKMLNVKMNFKNDPRNSQTLWRCESCQIEAPETQAHVLYCPAYQSLTAVYALLFDIVFYPSCA